MSHEIQTASPDYIPSAEVVEESQEAVGAVNAIYRDFITQAHERGLDQAGIKQSIVAALNEGVLPHTFKAAEYRGSGVDMATFTGPIPEDFFNVEELFDEDPIIKADGTYDMDAWDEICSGALEKYQYSSQDESNPFQVAFGRLPQQQFKMTKSKNEVLGTLERVRTALQASAYGQPDTTN